MSQRIRTNPAGKRVLAKIRQIQPFTEGSLTITTKWCGNPQCRCAHQGPLHQTALLTWKEANKTRSLYVPLALRKEVAQWIEQGRRLKQLVHQMSQAQRQFLISIRKSNKP